MPARKRAPKRRRAADQPDFSRLNKDLRRQLMSKLKNVDASILISVISQGEARSIPSADWFSDWPDSYNRDLWYKTWGKAEGPGNPKLSR